MKKLFILSFLVLFSCLLFAFGVRDASVDNAVRANTVVVYTYDSFVAEWGAAPILKQKFKMATGLDVVFVSAGDGAQVLSKAVLEKNAPQADVLLGIDNNQYATAKKSGALEPYAAADIAAIPSSFYFEQNPQEALLTPYDWSAFAFMYDSHNPLFKKTGVPSSLKDLTNPAYAKKIIILDPRLSTPGLGLFTWIENVYGDRALEYWNQLRPNILTMAPSWDTGYGMFTSGEAPLVISYTTSAPYHEECEQSDRFKAAAFSDGHIIQIEGAGLVKNCVNSDGAKKFLDFLITADVQQELFFTQWMFPVLPSVTVPSSFEKCNHGITFCQNQSPVSAAQIDRVISMLSR